MQNLIHISPEINPAVAAGAVYMGVRSERARGFDSPASRQHPQERRRRGRTRLSWSRLGLLTEASRMRGEGMDWSALCGESQKHVAYQSKRQSRYQARPAAPPHEKRPRSVEAVPRPKTVDHGFDSILVAPRRFVNLPFTVHGSPAPQRAGSSPLSYLRPRRLAQLSRYAGKQEAPKGN